jgi:hypothetical protein
MEEWKIKLYKLMDESDQPKELDKLAQKLFNYLSVTKIKDKKFKERMGPEYEKLVEHLNSDLSQDLIRDDDFFNLTIDLTRKYTSKTNQSKD